MLSAQFADFVAQHDKTYTRAEYLHRFEVFKTNVEFINEHNLEGHGYTVAINKFADMTNAEYKALYVNGYRRANRSTGVVPEVVGEPLATVDWVAKGAVMPIKDQGQCGSCWAFSATSTVESAHQIATGKLVGLSEQELVSCSTSYGNLGCNGGLMDSAFQYVMKSGQCTEAAYPYTATSDFFNCKSSSCAVAARITGYVDVVPWTTTANDNALIAATNLTPVSVAIEADTLAFQFYSSGVFDNANCGTTLDHGVVVTGYGTDTSSGTAVNYWDVRNSWGTSWGEAGYMRMIRGKDMCGINMEPSYPTGASN
jgi:cathepsin L